MPAQLDPFGGKRPDETIGPARNAEPVTPSDTIDLVTRPRFLIVSGAGNISMDLDNGITRIIACPAGIIPLSPIRVRATSTTATGITACW